MNHVSPASKNGKSQGRRRRRRAAQQTATETDIEWRVIAAITRVPGGVTAPARDAIVGVVMQSLVKSEFEALHTVIWLLGLDVATAERVRRRVYDRFATTAGTKPCSRPS